MSRSSFIQPRWKNSFLTYLSTKKKKISFSLERNIRIKYSSCQILSSERSYAKNDKKWLQLLVLSMVQLVAPASKGEQYKQTCISKSPVKPIIRTTSVFPRPKPLRDNHSSKREVLLLKVKWPKLENLHTAVNLAQHTQPHNAFPTQKLL